MCLSENVVGFDSTSHVNRFRNMNILVHDMGMQTDLRKFEDKSNNSCETQEIAVIIFTPPNLYLLPDQLIIFFRYKPPRTTKEFPPPIMHSQNPSRI